VTAAPTATPTAGSVSPTTPGAPAANGTTTAAPVAPHKSSGGGSRFGGTRLYIAVGAGLGLLVVLVVLCRCCICKRGGTRAKHSRFENVAFDRKTDRKFDNSHPEFKGFGDRKPRTSYAFEPNDDDSADSPMYEDDALA